MTKKAILTITILMAAVCCLGFAFADNDTAGNATADDIEDLANYIMPVSISDNGIEFSDGFTGFCLDPSCKILAGDGFTQEPAGNSDIENRVKLAIIESYKAGKSDEIGKIVSKVINNDSSDEIAAEVLSSQEKIGDKAVVNIDNATEATFKFELLKPSDDSKADCLAYNISMKKAAVDDKLGAANDETNDTLKTADDKSNATPTAAGDANDTKKAADSTANDTKKSDAGNKTKTAGNETVINETNTTIINKNNTVIVNENNTTVINQNNTKVINKTNETPKNATVQDTIMRTVGNPIFLLIVVVVIIAIVGVVMRGKGKI